MCHRRLASNLAFRVTFAGAVWAWAFVCGAWTPSYPPPRIPPGRTSTAVSRPFALIQTRTTRLEAKSKGNSDDPKDDDVVALLHSHHLLDHKPDNMILRGGKYKLRGAACLGRPGVALCIGPVKSISKFRASLESAMPQKRFKTKILPVPSGECSSIHGFEPTTLGDFRKVLASIGEEDEFFALTGIAPDVAADSSGRNHGKGADQERHDMGKKGRKRKRK